MTDVAIYVDVWRSLNGRFQQRLIDPRVNLLEAEWSPFRPTPWLMPLLTELSAWRQKLTQLERTVFNWSDSSRVAFVADFPGKITHTHTMYSDHTLTKLSCLPCRTLYGQLRTGRCDECDHSGARGPGGVIDREWNSIVSAECQRHSVSTFEGHAQNHDHVNRSSVLHVHFHRPCNRQRIRQRTPQQCQKRDLPPRRIFDDTLRQIFSFGWPEYTQSSLWYSARDA